MIDEALLSIRQVSRGQLVKMLITLEPHDKHCIWIRFAYLLLKGGTYVPLRSTLSYVVPGQATGMQNRDEA